MKMPKVNNAGSDDAKIGVTPNLLMVLYLKALKQQNFPHVG
jgi:hypothetical protein